MYLRRVLAGLVVPGLLAAGLLGGSTGCAARGAAAHNGHVTLRLGYFPNLTHATPIVGVDRGFYAQALGSGVTLQTHIFNAGPEAVQALFSGAVDAIYVGPNPTVNGWSQSKGKAIRVMAGAASGGVSFVVKPSIHGPADLKGRKIATPQLGNTQDVALRYWLKQHGLTATREGGGDVSIVPQANSTTVTAFATGAIDGAWVPEPYASKMVAAGGRVLVDERDLWPDGKFVITNLVVASGFLSTHREVVKRLIEGQVAANEFIGAHPDEARQVVNDALGRLAGKPLDTDVVTAAWGSLTFLDDPLAASLREGAAHAQQVGLLGPVDLAGLYDLSLLNEVESANGQPGVSA